MNATKTHPSRAIAGIILLMGTLIAGTGEVSAAPPPLACGMTVTSSARLKADLVDCSGDGLIVGAPGITIDLNGHVVDGDAVEGGDRPDAGIRNEGFHGVTIKNGAVQEFDNGVDLSHAIANSVSRIDTRSNFTGVLLEEGSNSSIVERVNAHDNAVGLVVLEADGVRIERSRVSSIQFLAIGGFGVTNTSIARNTVTGVDRMGDGINVDNGSNDNVIEHNTVTGVELPLIAGGDRNMVSNNTVFANAGGVIVFGDDNVAVSNRITDALGCGPDGGCGVGVSVEGGAGNIIAGNQVARTFDTGIRVDAYTGTATATVFRDNKITDAGKDGIAIGLDQAGVVEQTLVQRNRVTGSGGDGIDADDATATLIGNVLTRNAGYGIDAIEGVTDGGGNRATRNANPAQCSPNIAC